MTTYLQTLLAEVFRAQGAADAAGLAKRAAKDFEMDQRDSRVYELRCAHYSVDEVAGIVGVTHRRVEQIYRAQMILRRNSEDQNIA